MQSHNGLPEHGIHQTNKQPGLLKSFNSNLQNGDCVPLLFSACSARCAQSRSKHCVCLLKPQHEQAAVDQSFSVGHISSIIDGSLPSKCA